MQSRRIFYCCLGLMVIVIIYIIYWFSIATILEANLKDWIKKSANRNIVATYQKLKFDGFPLSIGAVISAPQLQIPTNFVEFSKEVGTKRWFWKGTRADFEIKPWNLNKIKVNLIGHQYFALISDSPVYEFLSEKHNILIDVEGLNNDWPENLQLRFQNIIFKKGKENVETKIKSATVDMENILHEGAGSTELKLKVKFNGIILPVNINFPLGNLIPEFSTSFRVMGLSKPKQDQNSIVSWRDSGGTIEIDSVYGKFRQLKLKGSGTLALDQEFQPLLAMSAELEGLTDVIDILTRGGHLTFKKALMLKLGLRLFSKNIDGVNSSFSLPLTIQDRELTVGPIKLLRLPLIRW